MELGEDTAGTPTLLIYQAELPGTLIAILLHGDFLKMFFKHLQNRCAFLNAAFLFLP